MITNINQLDLTKSYTYADYMTWQFDHMVELIRGKVIKMSPAPSRFHQELSRNLFLPIAIYFSDKKCKAFHAPFDVRLPSYDSNGIQLKDTVVQPDLCVVCDISKLDNQGCNGAPDLVVEILSPSTSRKDLTEKYDLYEQCGVAEYWVVHPTEQTLLVFQVNSKGNYQLYQRPFVKGDTMTSPLFPDLAIDMDKVFDY